MKDFVLIKINGQKNTMQLFTKNAMHISAFDVLSGFGQPSSVGYLHGSCKGKEKKEVTNSTMSSYDINLHSTIYNILKSQKNPTHGSFS